MRREREAAWKGSISGQDRRGRGREHFVCGVCQSEHSKAKLNGGETLRSQKIVVHHCVVRGVVEHEPAGIFTLELIVLSKRGDALADEISQKLT